jgi:uncharacterized membrane protein YcaP (DUF421 family)
MAQMIFHSWQDLGRVIFVGVFAYAAVVVFLRASGNRTLSKLNAFDLVVTVALGSTLATIILNKDVALSEGLLALGLLIGLQFTITWCSVRFSRFSHVVKSEPALLVFNGAVLETAMRRARVVEAELLAVLRSEGIHDLQSVHGVVLESDGSLSVLRTGTDRSADTLKNLEKPSGL